MKIIFLGTPSIALEVLKTLLESHEVLAVITQPDKPSGRSKTPVPSPVAQLARDRNIPLYKTEFIDEKLASEIRNLNTDVFITFAYGVILKRYFFDVARLGGINIHPSLLPEYRGPSPIQTAILDGRKVSGITIQTVKLKVDSGDILMQENFDILPEDDAITVEEKVASLAAKMINELLDELENGRTVPVIQDENKVTRCRMINKSDGLIDWNESAEMIFNKARAFVKWPVAFTYIEGKKLNIYRCRINESINKEMFTNFQNGVIVIADKKKGITVKCHDSYLDVELLQMQGKKILDWKDFLNGHADLAGKKFSGGVE